MTTKDIISTNTESTVVAEYDREICADDSYQSEAQLEAQLLQLLCAQGYQRVAFASEADMIGNLRVQLQKLNKFTFTDSEWGRFFAGVIANGNDGVIEKARTMREDSIKSFILDNGDTINISLINKVNIHANVLQVMNQYTNTGNRHNIYDVTILVNGLPLVHIELKRRGVRLVEAFNQIDRYKRDSFWANSGLYEYIQIFVISNGTYTKYYSNTTRSAHSNGSNRRRSNTFAFTSYWADKRNKVIYDLVDFTKTFFVKHTLLNVLTKYCVFTSEQRLLVMRPYQIVATEEILNAIEINHNAKTYGKKASGGYIWHTTGSGKTLTSFKTAQLATAKGYIGKVLFVVDRKDLDYQTMQEYDRFQRGCANSNSSTAVLARQLADPDSRIIITTIQKLSNFIARNTTHDVYGSEVVLIFDECHRSQFGDMHKAIARKFKKHYMFGFTGTPIFESNVSSNNHYQTTESLFGRQLHNYTIVDAISDKNVLPFRVDYIKTVEAKDKIVDRQVTAIDDQSVLLDDIRISNIVQYIVANFARKTQRNDHYSHKALSNVVSVAKSNRAERVMSNVSLSGFNSIFAVSSIEAAKLYYNKFMQTEHDLKVAMIYSYPANEEESDGLEEENNEDTTRLDAISRDFLDTAISHYNDMFGTSYDTSGEKFQNYYRDVSLRMKNREIDILIVVNMFLTGFDATTLNTLWVDKNLKYHGLMQSFSRTNRILNSIKTFGNIVCFRNLEKQLNDALELFGNNGAKGTVILKTFEQYMNGYSDEHGFFEGYIALASRLVDSYPIGVEIIGEQSQKSFVNLYGQILRVRNILLCFDQFACDSTLTTRQLQEYQSMYLQIRDEFRSVSTADRENINDDIVFEMELIKQVDINIDYILELLQQYVDGNFDNKEILLNIERTIDASVSLRNKKDLIMAFIASLNSGENAIGDFVRYINKQRIIELDRLIEAENLKKAETYEFVSKCFKDGRIEMMGPELSAILPPMSRFSRTGASLAKKNKVLALLDTYFDRFFTISTSEFVVDTE